MSLRTSHRLPLVFSVVLVLAATITPAVALPGQHFERQDAVAPTVDAATADCSQGVGSDNFCLVENIPHSKGGRGSDIEFASLTYTDAAAAAVAGYADPAADALPEVAGIQKDIALAGTTGTAFYLYDVTDPANVYETAAYDCKANQGDTQVFTREESGVTRTYTTLTVEETSANAATNSQCYTDAGLDEDGASASGTFIIDLSDPFAPLAVAHISVPEGSHNGSVHPSGNYFYNSNSSLYDTIVRDGGPGIEYYDISDFGNIERLGRLALPIIPLSLGTESHDITFNTLGDRAYSAALSQGVILDTTDPADPQIITSFVDPTIQVWHQSDPIILNEGEANERELLVVEDEVAGATPTGQCPNGGVHVFDITGDLENTPLKVGYWNIDEARPNVVDGSPVSACTAHVFRLYPDAGLMTISYYNGGVRVVDLNGLAGIGLGELGAPVPTTDPMVQIGFRRFTDSNSWAAKAVRIDVNADGAVQPFHVFSNDSRGLDVLLFDGTPDAEAMSQSNWMTPAEAQASLPRFTPAQLAANRQFVCFLD